jgi:hypothetical protein
MVMPRSTVRCTKAVPVKLLKTTGSDWIMDSGNITKSNDGLNMLLTESNGGTRLSSTRYVHYGTITATRMSLHREHLAR